VILEKLGFLPEDADDRFDCNYINKKNGLLIEVQLGINLSIFFDGDW
jgi:hypothetical protein